MTRGDTGAVHTPTTMVHRARWCPAFDNTDQQDVHEAFQFLLQNCDEIDAEAMQAQPLCLGMTRGEWDASEYRHSTPYNQIFGNLQLARITCLACGHTTEQYERAHAHQLSLEKEEHHDLAALLTEHLGREPLDEQYRCDSCEVRGRCVKTTEVVEWPPVLAISLKRFQFDMRTKTVRKNPRPIRYPMIFRIQEEVVEYHLRAVIVHGGNAGVGHYVAYVRALDNLWYFCNDSATPQLMPRPIDVLHQQAYMLIYEL